MKRWFLKRVTTEHYTVVARTREEARQVVIGEPEVYRIGKTEARWEVEGHRPEPTGVRSGA